MRGGCSDDAFEYFRAWLILQGRVAFTAVMDDPAAFDRFYSGLDPQCEWLLYAAGEAYENKKGEPMKAPAPPQCVLTGTEWTEEELPERYPELCARYGYNS